ncbi:hypothetical protein ABTG60_07010, partial [Acinetobacter baumannii]
NRRQNQPKTKADSARGGGGARTPRAPITAPTNSRPAKPELPEEVKLLKKFAPIGANRIRVNYTLNGLLSRELRVPSQGGEGFSWISQDEAEDLLGLASVKEAEGNLLRRAETRLGLKGLKPPDLAGLTDEQSRILRLSQKEYNSFLASQEAPPDYPGED